jgi:uncharacterized membrane protein YheB (UPF0754 family)
MILLTNLLSILFIIAGVFSPVYQSQLLNIGIFAFAGAVTNWLAIYMLFEKVPFLYGSGVIPTRFKEFKLGIRNLIVKEFFNKQHIEKFFQNNDVSDITKTIDLDKIYDGLVEEILKTQLGGMLQMFGGKGALQPLREPIKAKIAEIIKDLTSNPEKSSGTLSALTDKVENIIDARLEELTPQMVKQIVKDMINEHLSWLVLWGGVFGGLIGFGFSFVKL